MTKPIHVPIDCRSAEHYRWGGACEGWRYLDEGDMGVILERVPDGATEEGHAHRRVRQLFFVLEGEASLEPDGAVVRFGPGQAIHVPPGTPHRFFNDSGHDVRVLVISSNPARHDRVELPERATATGCAPETGVLP